MQNSNEDTEWNDVLRRKGILPAKEKEIDEKDIVQMMEETIQKKSVGQSMSEKNLDELNDIEDDIDDEDERFFEEYKRQRLAEMKADAHKSQFGDVREISKQDYVTEVNQAGDGIWVVLHVYKQSLPLCKLLDAHLRNLARKFPQTKFLRSEVSVCIPNYPDKNLPTIFVYYEGDMKKQFIGPFSVGGMNCTQNELEWMLSETGAVKTTLEENPRTQVKDKMAESLKNHDDPDDW